ncbi:MAG: DUF4139 domain-containing protein [Bacteroidia bacterium]
MKNLLTTLAAFAFCSVFAQNNPDEVNVNTKPENITVYLSGAQIEAKGSALLKSSTKTVVFPNLSNYVDANSVQVKANTDITIMAVNFRLNYLQPTENKEFKMLEDSLEKQKKDIARVVLKKDSYKEELTILQSNRSIGGNNVGVSVAELTKMADFIQTRYHEASLKYLEHSEKEEDMRKDMKRMENQLNQIRSQGSKPTGEIVVQLGESVSLNTTFELTYYVTNCGWVPMYDIRVKDVNSQADITAKANVYQNTGDDWKNVNLSLSTGNPSRGNTKPQINPWQLYLSNKNTARAKANYPKSMNMMAPMESRSDEMRDMPQSINAKTIQVLPGLSSGSSVTPSSFTNVNTTTTNSIFDIKIPYTIKSDGKDNIVEIQKYEVSAKYAYFAIPKVDRDAFLVADLIGWDKNELLPGDANVYFEKNYVGKTYFDSRIVDDTLSFALGRDNNVRIDRKKVKELSEKVNITNNYIKQTREFEIDLKNTRKSEITIELEDQIPMSTNEELTIEKINAEGAIYDKQTGKLTWNITLAPGQSKTLKFGYSVKYPKNMVLGGF